MDRKHTNWLRAAFLLSFFGAGIPYWLIPYHQVNLPSALMSPSLVLIGIAALLLRAALITPFWKTVRFLGSTLAAAVLARVMVEGILDPSSHNLWPFEIAIALVLGFACSLAGAAIGNLIARLGNHAQVKDPL
jgi:hypothetical protein